MDTPRAALIAAIREAPDDDAPRLVMADWFEDRGDPASVARAAFIRAQVERARLPPTDPRQSELQALELRLLKRHGPAWCGSHHVFKKVRFRRGFIEYVHLHLRHFQHHRRQMLALEPVRDVRLTGFHRAPVELVRRVAACAEWRDVETLRIHHQGPHKEPGAVVLDLLESPHLTRLRGLHALMLALDATGRRRFERLPLLRTLDALEIPTLNTYPHQPGQWFSDGGGALAEPGVRLRSLQLPLYLTVDALLTFTAMPVWQHLTGLHVTFGWHVREFLTVLGERLPQGLQRLTLTASSSPIDYTGGTAFFDQLTQRPLEHLTLHLAPLSVSTLRRLFLRKCNWQLRELDLGYCGLSEPHVRVLTESQLLGGVTSLGLGGNEGIKAAAVRALAASKALPSLVHLDLRDTTLGSAGLSALARARHWPALRSLNLYGVEGKSPILPTLLEGPGCQRLTWLSVRDADLDLRKDTAFPPHLASLCLDTKRVPVRARKRLAEQPGVAWLTEPPADNSPQAWRASLAPERFPPVDETWQWGHSYGAR